MSAKQYPIDPSYDDGPAPARPATARADADADQERAITVKVESSLLGAVLTVGMIPFHPPRPTDFLEPAHAATWEAILAVAARGDPTTMVTVLWELHKTGRVDRAGGVAYFSAHVNSCDCDSIAVYARTVKEAANLRKLNRLKA